MVIIGAFSLLGLSKNVFLLFFISLQVKLTSSDEYEVNIIYSRAPNSITYFYRVYYKMKIIHLIFRILFTCLLKDKLDIKPSFISKISGHFITSDKIFGLLSKWRMKAVLLNPGVFLQRTFNQ